MKIYILLLFIISITFAQQKWIKTYGGTNYDWGFSVQQTMYGGYIIAGTTISFGAGARDVYLIKTDSTGDTLWTRTYGGTNEDYGYSVQQTSDGGYIIVGATDSFNPFIFDVYLIKTNAFGDTLWTRTYGGVDYDRGWSVQQTLDGDYIIAGETWSFGAGSADVYLIKTDTTGNIQWINIYGGPDEDYGYSVHQTSDGGYIIVGYTTSFGTGAADVYFIKTDSTGDTLWTKTYGGTNEDYGYSVQQTSDGGYIIAGWTYSFGTGAADVYLIKTNATGDTLWTRIYGGEWDDDGYSVKQTLDGGYIIAGDTRSFGAGYFDVYLIKADSLGNSNDVEEENNTVLKTSMNSTIICGPLQLFPGRSCHVFDITGRMVRPEAMKPGIYFIEIDGKITQKVIKVR